MNLIGKKIIDYAEPLENSSHEKFCLEYFRLDIEDHIVNKKYRRIKSYRFVFPEALIVDDGKINSRACSLIKTKNVSERLKYLYEEYGTSIESEYAWTRAKSEDVLLRVIYSKDEKQCDRLKAIQILNTMKGVDVKEYVIEKKVTEKSKWLDTIAESDANEN